MTYGSLTGIVSIYIYITEASEVSTIFHVNTIFKYNIKTNLKKKNIKTDAWEIQPLSSNI